MPIAPPPLWADLLLGSMLLGMLHGVVPDEHTWPITFSYSVGSATGKGGLVSGVYFAAAFTLQRAIMAQLVYFAVGSWLEFDSKLNGPVYAAVGAAMAIAGYLILYNRLPHWHPLMWISNRDRLKHANEKNASKRVPIHWCIIHGFIAGFGVDTGLFTTFVYLVAVPSMPSYLLGFAPGAAFGLGTLVVLLVIGTVFGGVLQIANKWGTERVQLFGSRVGARSLLFGGIIFMVAGLLYVAGLSSALPVNFGDLLVVVFMVAVIVPVMFFTWREVRAMPVGGDNEEEKKKQKKQYA